MGYYDMVEAAWTLADAAREYAESAGRAVDTAELWEKIFSSSPLVDFDRTRQEGGQPLTRVFLKSPYGLQYHPDQNDWRPFRYGPIDLSKESNL